MSDTPVRAQRHADERPAPRTVIVSGASGLVGSALVGSLRADGTRVTRLARRAPQAPDELQWQPGERLDPELIAGATAVVNLNGASIGRLPWGKRYRQQLIDSRLTPTRTLATAISELGDAAPHFVSASAVGYYGDRPGEVLSESSTAGSTFLAALSAEWEAAALPASTAVRARGGGTRAAAGPRVTLLRTAPILHRRGVLKPLILLTRLGISGPLGHGTQIWPWISLDDEVRAIRHVIDTGLTGPVNLTDPTPATASEIGRAIAAQLGRPYLMPAPAWALRLALGRDAADSLLLSDANVAPAALAASGFHFSHRTAAQAVRAALDT